jgi:hypothetical protein
MTERTTIGTIEECALGIHRYGGGERCVVSHLDVGGPCGQPATILVWELPFCEVHGAEAEAAALSDLIVDAERELEMLACTEEGRLVSNPAVIHALNQVAAPGRGEAAGYERTHKEALYAAYPPIRPHRL